MSNKKEMAPIQSAITLLESERVESPQTDMDRLNNEIIGRLVIRLGALKGMEREFARELFVAGEAHAFVEDAISAREAINGSIPDDFDTFYSKYEG